jgi:hypothetical protein
MDNHIDTKVVHEGMIDVDEQIQRQSNTMGMQR